MTLPHAQNVKLSPLQMQFQLSRDREISDSKIDLKTMGTGDRGYRNTVPVTIRSAHSSWFYSYREIKNDM